MSLVRKTTIMAAAIAVPLAAVVILGGAPAESQELEHQIEFDMLAQHVGTGPGGQTPVTMAITRLSTTDERDSLEQVFINDGMQALADALRDAPEVGFVRTPRAATTSWRLRYAMAFDDGKGGRIFRLACDRPISFVEAVRRPVRTWDYNVTLIELTVDAEGNGTGTLMAGVEFAYDQTNDAFSVKSLSSEPVRLTNVRTKVQQQ